MRYQVVKERVVDDTKNGLAFVDEAEGDADEWEAVNKVGGAI